MIRFLLTLFALLAVGYFWIWPIVKSRPSVKALLAEEGSWLSALREKFAGIKQRLTAAFVSGAAVVVAVHDYVAPALVAVDTAPIVSQIPPSVWLGLVIGTPLLLNFFRWLSDRRED